MSLYWVSEESKLPKVGQTILLATPRQSGDFWDLRTAWLAIRHEAVQPRPITKGARWATDFWWQHDKAHILVTGNGWWSPLSEISLPPGAEHDFESGYHFVRQIGAVFVSQSVVGPTENQSR